jgi:ribosomal protein L37AE/L43A
MGRRKKITEVPQKLEHSKDWCSYCGKKTMMKNPEVYKSYVNMEVWECLKCRLLERYKI